MYQSFSDIEAELLRRERRVRVALAGADDDRSLVALLRAHDKGIVEPLLVGDAGRVRDLLGKLGRDPDAYQIIDEPTENMAAMSAIGLVADGDADVPMKGLMQTSTFLMALSFGGVADDGALLSEYTILEMESLGRLLVCGDCAVNVAPTLEEKATILRDLIDVSRALGANPVRAAALSVVEKRNPAIQSSVDAAELAEMDWGKDVVCEGPLALDAILDAESAQHKGIRSEVAGRPDVILMPSIDVGNVFHKCAHFMGGYPFASGLLGANVPVVMNSRTDTPDAKYNSVLAACLQVGR